MIFLIASKRFFGTGRMGNLRFRMSVCSHFLEFRASDFTILKKCAKLLARGSWWRCILFVGIHRSRPHQNSAKLFFMTSYWQQYRFFMVPVADSKMFRFLESCSGVLFQWIELIHEAQVLASGLSTLVCDSISGFEGLAAGNCCVCAPLMCHQMQRMREVDRLVLAKQVSRLGKGQDSLDPFRNTVKPPESIGKGLGLGVRLEIVSSGL